MQIRQWVQHLSTIAKVAVPAVNYPYHSNYLNRKIGQVISCSHHSAQTITFLREDGA
jgi:hypothetical protein